MYSFPNPEKINYEQFFLFDKEIIKDMRWASLPKVAKGIYPVIACHANKNGKAFPGETTIAILSGYREMKVREGTKKLEEFRMLDVSKKKTKKGYYRKEYKINLPKEEDQTKIFLFHKTIFEGGNWRELKHSAQALYPVMRCFSNFNADLYSEIENMDGVNKDDDFREMFRYREWDFCSETLNKMAKFSGITRRTIKEAINSLQENFLIEPIERGWKVFINPKKFWKSEFMNKKISSKYGR